jgi:hypothetical protein
MLAALQSSPAITDRVAATPNNRANVTHSHFDWHIQRIQCWWGRWQGTGRLLMCQLRLQGTDTRTWQSEQGGMRGG